jgi:hypothetical protein
MIGIFLLRLGSIPAGQMSRAWALIAFDPMRVRGDHELYQISPTQMENVCLGISQSEFDCGRLPLGLSNRTDGISSLSILAEAI